MYGIRKRKQEKETPYYMVGVKGTKKRKALSIASSYDGGSLAGVGEGVVGRGLVVAK